MTDQFTIWIKKMVNGGRINPPKEAWGNISQKMDLEDSWSNIDKQLDIDRVWDRLDHQLAQDVKMNTYEKISYVPIIALLLLLSWLGLQNEFATEPLGNTPSIAQVTSTENKTSEDQHPAPRKKQPFKKTQNEKSSVKPAAVSEKQTSVLNSKNKSFTTEELNPSKPTSDDNKKADSKSSALTKKKVDDNKNSLNPLTSFPANLVVNLDTIDREAPSLVHFETDSILKNSDDHSWFYGIGISANRTWLQDNRLKRASTNSSLYDAIANNNISYKITTGLDLNSHWTVQADLTILGSIGQSYGEYINGKYKYGQTNVNYNGLQIGIKRDFSRILNYGTSIRKQIIIGSYANHIHEVNQSENIVISNEKNKQSISDLYRNFDMGFFVGIEMFYPIHNSYQLGTTLHYKYGLTNIYKGNNQIPAYLRKTNTSELSLSVILKRSSK